MAGVIHVLDPRAATRPAPEQPLPTLSDLRGRRVAILKNGWLSLDRMAEYFEKVLKEQYRVAGVRHERIPTSNKTDPALLAAVSREADAAIVGLAN